MVSHILCPLWRSESGIILPFLQDGLIAYLDMICVDSIMKNELEDSVLKFFYIGKDIFVEEKLF